MGKQYHCKQKAIPFAESPQTIYSMNKYWLGFSHALGITNTLIDLHLPSGWQVTTPHSHGVVACASTGPCYCWQVVKDLDCCSQIQECNLADSYRQGTGRHRDGVNLRLGQEEGDAQGVWHLGCLIHGTGGCQWPMKTVPQAWELFGTRSFYKAQMRLCWTLISRKKHTRLWTSYIPCVAWALLGSPRRPYLMIIFCVDSPL